ncbi:MAG: lipopolysaccharide heptosyltransferase I [Candidatus Korobacteraceae bacterium]
MATPVSLAANRVLVVRLSAMGDIIHAMPAITALRQVKSDIQIGWLVEERWAELLCSRESEYMAPRSQQKPLVDWVHVANFKTWRKALAASGTWQEIGARRSEIREINYGATLDLQGAIRSALAARATGAKIRVGSSQPREGPARMFYTRQVEPRGAHVVDQALALVSAIAGEELQYADPLFPIDPAAETWADQFCGTLGDGPLAILNPGAGWGAKCWPAESFGTVARALAERGMTPVVNHGPGEEPLADAVRDSSGKVAVAVKCSIGELIALTRRAQLFVGGDTGPMHLAAALRVPVVALFGPTRPERNGPYGTRSVVLRNPGSVYNTTHTDHPDEGLMSIAPDEVIAAIDQLLGESRG